MAITFILLGFIVLLVLADAILSLLPRKGKSGNVSVTFLPPSATPFTSSSSDAKLDAHISSTNQKISQLFFRMEKIEHALHALVEQAGVDNMTAPSDATWLETIPVRKRRK